MEVSRKGPAIVKSFPIYYGWVNVFIAALAMSSTLPGRTYGLGLIKVPLCADLGIDDLRFGLINFLAIIIGAVVVLPTGWLIDRIGSRWTLGFISGLLAGSVLFMARSTSEMELAITLTLVRGLGQGALSVVAIALVGKWFRRRCAAAMGVFSVLLAIGFIAPAVPLADAVNIHGWRATWAMIGYVLLFGLFPLGLMFARNSPESCGVTPDEPAVSPAEEQGRNLTAGPSEAPLQMTVWEAVATPCFWIYTAASAVFNLAFSALTLDVELLLDERGLDGASGKGLIMAVLVFSGMPVNILAGYLARFVSMGKLLGAGVMILALSLLVFPFVTSLIGAGIYAALLGASGGVVTVIYFAIYGHIYGRAHLGRIQAVVQVLSVFASAVGPLFLAFVREQNERNTSPFFFGFATITAFLAIAAWVVKPPARVQV